MNDLDVRFDSVIEGMNEESRMVDLVIIDEGEGSSAVYPADKLMTEAGKFVASKMYIDHQTRSQERQRAGMPRSVRDWVSTVKEAEWDSSINGIRAKVHVVQDWFWNFLREAKEDIGVSINATARVRKSEEGGKEKPIFESFSSVKSVDWVTQAGRGGRVLSLLESHLPEDDESEVEEDMKIDWSKVTIEQLKEEAPELYEELTAKEEEPEPIEDEEPEPVVETEIELTEAEVRMHRAATSVAVKELVEASSLPAASKKAVLASFKEAVYINDVDLAKAVKSAVEAQQELLVGLGIGRVRDMGQGGDGNDSTPVFDKAQSALLESLGYSAEEVKGLMEVRS